MLLGDKILVQQTIRTIDKRSVLEILTVFLCTSNNDLENTEEGDPIHSINKNYAISNQCMRSSWRKLMFY